MATEVSRRIGRRPRHLASPPLTQSVAFDSCVRACCIDLFLLFTLLIDRIWSRLEALVISSISRLDYRHYHFKLNP